jgi:choline-sulfatase
MPDRPNILFVFTDQQHFGSISALGCEHARTPAMDRLVAEGVAFGEVYATDPVCAPCRSSFFTGRMPCETGVWKNELGLIDSLPTLGQWIGDRSDYRRIYAGKWHLIDCKTYDIPGFDVISTGVNCEGNLSDTTITRAAEAYLRRHDRNEPLLMVVSYQQPHDVCGWITLNADPSAALRHPEIADRLPPLPPNAEPVDGEPQRVGRKRGSQPSAKAPWSEQHWRYYLWCYYRQVEMVDTEIGRLLRTLDETGLADETVVIFTSDHGEGLGRHELVTKSMPYDETARLPLVIRHPGRVAPGRRDDAHLVSALDVFPTICDYAGVDPPAELLGRSIRPLAEGRDAPGREYVIAACDQGEGRLVRTARHRYVAFRNDPNEMLFDLAADPGETTNLAADPTHADALAYHRRLLREWEARMAYTPDAPRYYD